MSPTANFAPDAGAPVYQFDFVTETEQSGFVPLGARLRQQELSREEMTPSMRTR